MEKLKKFNLTAYAYSSPDLEIMYISSERGFCNSGTNIPTTLESFDELEHYDKSIW